MLFAVSGLMDCPVEASDGEVGSVKDFLFDDQTWKICWMAVEAGSLVGWGAAGCSPSIRRPSRRWRCRQGPPSR